MEVTALQQQVAELHDRYGGLVRRRAAMLLGSAEAAEDVVQDTFVRVMQNLANFRGEASPVTWLYRMTTNLCIDQLRRQARSRTVDVGPDMLEVLKEHSMVSEGQLIARHDLARFIRKLDARSLRILVHAYIDDMSQEEIAQMTDLSRKTVWTTLQRLKQRLKKGLS